MTRDELIAAVPIREAEGRLYVRMDEVPVNRSGFRGGRLV